MMSTLFEYMENVKAKIDAKFIFKAHLLKAVTSEGWHGRVFGFPAPFRTFINAIFEPKPSPPLQIYFTIDEVLK